ncbi:MAG: RNA-binding protein [Desulfuromonadales bacterium]|nr:RNA-binding protein [Desulfuromonadales bacterium]
MKKNTKVRDIYVTDISFDVDEEDIRKLFSVCGTVRSVKLMTDERTGNFTGRAFVRMGNDAETQDAIKTLDGARLINRCIRVHEAKPAEAAPPADTPPRERSRRPPKGRRR